MKSKGGERIFKYRFPETEIFEEKERERGVGGVPAKLSNRENVHLTILRQRILIRRQNSPAKHSHENVHQPRICAPNSLHFAHVVHFANGDQNLLLHLHCRSEGFAHDTSRSGSAAARNQCLAHLSFSSCSLFNFLSFQRNAHGFAV